MMDHMVLLYDLGDYAGRGSAPGYKRGDPRFVLAAYSRDSGARFHCLIWHVIADTRAAVMALVPPKGRRFDRTGNTPSAMVPVEGWKYEARAALGRKE